MGKDADTTITSCCTLKGASTTLSFEPSEVIEELKKTLEKRLMKKGIALRWTDESGTPELLVRVVQIDQGNQFLRYLLPFLSPTVLEVEGQVTVPGSDPRPFHYVQKAQMGLFGGSARGMLKVCADRVAGKIAGDALKAFQ
jgi:hypothetical protein